MWVYHDFSLLPGSRATFPEVDPDPAKWYGSNRIRIRNTANNNNTIYLFSVNNSSLLTVAKHEE